MVAVALDLGGYWGPCVCDAVWWYIKETEAGES